MTLIDSIRFREATPADQETLDAMNVAASFGAIRPESEYPDTHEFLGKHPDIADFSKNYGRDGDMGIIAEDAEGQVIGAVWGREYPRTEDDGPMQGHPFEITMAVVEAARNCRVGHQLLVSIAIMAAAQDKSEITLVVHQMSPARRLYEREGYVPLRDDKDAKYLIGGKYIPMVLKLRE